MPCPLVLNKVIANVGLLCQRPYVWKVSSRRKEMWPS